MLAIPTLVPRFFRCEKPVGYHHQHIYTTDDIEIISIAGVLQWILHHAPWPRNPSLYWPRTTLTFQNLQSQRAIRWRLFLEVFHPNFTTSRVNTTVLPMLSPASRRHRHSDSISILRIQSTYIAVRLGLQTINYTFHSRQPTPPMPTPDRQLNLLLHCIPWLLIRIYSMALCPSQFIKLCFQLAFQSIAKAQALDTELAELRPQSKTETTYPPSIYQRYTIVLLC